MLRENPWRSHLNEVRSQKSEVRSQKSEVRSQKSGVPQGYILLDRTAGSF
ncbi:MAG: hypothetical protein ACFCU7_17295 [Pleurocapsa sp.]